VRTRNRNITTLKCQVRKTGYQGLDHLLRLLRIGTCEADCKRRAAHSKFAGNLGQTDVRVTPHRVDRPLNRNSLPLTLVEIQAQVLDNRRERIHCQHLGAGPR